MKLNSLMIHTTENQDALGMKQSQYPTQLAKMFKPSPVGNHIITAFYLTTQNISITVSGVSKPKILSSCTASRSYNLAHWLSIHRQRSEVRPGVVVNIQYQYAERGIRYPQEHSTFSCSLLLQTTRSETAQIPTTQPNLSHILSINLYCSGHRESQ